MEGYYPLNIRGQIGEIEDGHAKERDEVEHEWLMNARENILKINQEGLHESVMRRISNILQHPYVS